MKEIWLSDSICVIFYASH